MRRWRQSECKLRKGNKNDIEMGRNWRYIKKDEEINRRRVIKQVKGG